MLRSKVGVLHESIKAAVVHLLEGGTSKHALAKKVGVSIEELKGFLEGTRTIRLTTADKLATILNLEVVQRAEPGKIPDPKLGRPKGKRGE